jgi:hypothetical protein
VSNRSFNRDFLTAYEAVFVDPESVHSIADGLASVLQFENWRKALSASALAESVWFILQKRVQGIKGFIFEQIEIPDEKGLGLSLMDR